MLEFGALVSEGDFDVTRRLHHFTIGWNKSQSVYGFDDRHVAYLIILIADH